MRDIESENVKKEYLATEKRAYYDDGTKIESLALVEIVKIVPKYFTFGYKYELNEKTKETKRCELYYKDGEIIEKVINSYIEINKLVSEQYYNMSEKELLNEIFKILKFRKNY